MREVVKIEKKSRILDAAALLFSRRQYHEVMIEDVAKLASIAKGTVYNYFSSKEEIYFSIMLERMDTLINSLAQKIKSTDDKAALEAYVVHLYMFMMKYQDFFLMYRKETLKAENQLCSAIAKMHNQLKEMLKQIIISGIERKVFRNMNAGFAADLIIGSIYAAVDRGIEKNYSDKYMIKERAETFNFIYEGMSSRKEELPLAGKRIILTRTEEQNRESAPLFESAGAEVISLPMIKIEEMFDQEKFNEYILEDPDFLVFMSANGVRIFSDNLKKSGKPLKENIKIAVVGNKTADECLARGFNVDIIPERHSAEGLMESFSKDELAGKKFLIPRSAVGRNDFINYLKECNAVPLVLDMYTVTAPDISETRDKLKDIYETSPDVIVFASPSAFNNFVQLSGAEGEELLWNTKIAAIGSTTGKVILDKGYTVSFQPEDFSLEGIRDSLIEFYTKEKE